MGRRGGDWTNKMKVGVTGCRIRIGNLLFGRFENPSPEPRQHNTRIEF